MTCDEMEETIRSCYEEYKDNFDFDYCIFPEFGYNICNLDESKCNTTKGCDDENVNASECIAHYQDKGCDWRELRDEISIP